MNANELADIQAFETDELTMWIRHETATMLRQQQAEIGALKQIIDANNLSQNIGQFVKPTNEPVAWMGIRRHGETRVSVEKLDKDDIPLYTHPVKELTDEEIVLVWDKMRFIVLDEDKTIIEFARAILRKAQEK